MRLTRQQFRRRAGYFKKFIENNPPKMPAEFSHAEWKRIIRYARIAFVTGYLSGANDMKAGDL